MRDADASQDHDRRDDLADVYAVSEKPGQPALMEHLHDEADPVLELPHPVEQHEAHRPPGEGATFRDISREPAMTLTSGFDASCGAVVGDVSLRSRFGSAGLGSRSGLQHRQHSARSRRDAARSHNGKINDSPSFAWSSSTANPGTVGGEFVEHAARLVVVNGLEPEPVDDLGGPGTRRLDLRAPPRADRRRPSPPRHVHGRCPCPRSHARHPAPRRRSASCPEPLPPAPIRTQPFSSPSTVKPIACSPNATLRSGPAPQPHRVEAADLVLRARSGSGPTPRTRDSSRRSATSRPCGSVNGSARSPKRISTGPDLHAVVLETRARSRARRVLWASDTSIVSSLQPSMRPGAICTRGRT